MVFYATTQLYTYVVLDFHKVLHFSALLSTAKLQIKELVTGNAKYSSESLKQPPWAQKL